MVYISQITLRYVNSMQSEYKFIILFIGDWDNDYFVVNKVEYTRPFRILLKEEKYDEKVVMG